MADIIGGVVNGVTGVVDALLPINRYLVTMTSAFALPDGSVATHQATDHVASADIADYVADARTRWQVVTVADKPDTIMTPYKATASKPQEG